MRNNTLMPADSTITEIYEEIFPSSLSLKSRMFIRLQKMSGGYWEQKKFNDYFQINCLAIIYFIVLILLEIRDKNPKIIKIPNEERYIIRIKIDEPAFFKKSLDSYPLSENCQFRA
jgi:hypothetical protein